MKRKRLHIIQYWLPTLVVLVLMVFSLSFWGVPIKFNSYGPDPGLTRGFLVLVLMTLVLLLMLLYRLLERWGVPLIPWLVWLHMGISLIAVLSLCGGLCTFRTVSLLGVDLYNWEAWEASVVGFSHLSRAVFWFLVGQCVLMGHLLVLLVHKI